MKTKNQPLVPLTVRQVLEASMTSGDTNEFLVDGVSVGSISLVGQLLSAEELSTTLNYTVDDGTATIDLRVWTDKEGNEFIRTQAPTWEKGRYVRVIGTIHQFKNQRSLVSNRLILVEDSNEILFHHLEALQAHLRRQKGRIPSATSTSSTARSTSASTSTSTSTSSTTRMKPQQPQRSDSGMNELQANIVHLIKQGDPQVGVGLADLVESLNGMSTEQEIRDALKFLQDEGTVFTTTDDDHFALTDS